MVSSCKQILDIESFGCSDKCYDTLNITNACERLGIQSKLVVFRVASGHCAITSCLNAEPVVGLKYAKNMNHCVNKEYWRFIYKRQRLCGCKNFKLFYFKRGIFLLKYKKFFLQKESAPK